LGELTRLHETNPTFFEQHNRNQNRRIEGHENHKKRKKYLSSHKKAQEAQKSD